MIPKNLSITERLILANQFRILAKLEDDEDSYASRVQILENGIEGQYDKVFSNISENVVTAEVSKEVIDILDMFWSIQNALKRATTTEQAQLDLEALSFRGFDGNHDFAQRTFIDWYNDNRGGSYKSLGDLDINSHSRLTIDGYRAMLKLYNSFGEYPQLTFDQLKQLQDPATLYK